MLTHWVFDPSILHPPAWQKAANLQPWAQWEVLCWQQSTPALIILSCLQIKWRVNTSTSQLTFQPSMSKALPCLAFFFPLVLFVSLGFGIIVVRYVDIIPRSKAKAHACLHHAYDKKTGKWQETRPVVPIWMRSWTPTWLGMQQGWWRWQVWDAGSWQDCPFVKWQAVTNLFYFHTERNQCLLVNVQGAQENHIHPFWCKFQLEFITTHVQWRSWRSASAQNQQNGQIVIKGFCLMKNMIWAEWEHFRFS